MVPWLNPKVAEIYDAVRHVSVKMVKAVMVLPDWEDEHWQPWLWPMVVSYYHYPQRTRLYQSDEPRWGSWAVHLYGAATMSGEGLPDAHDTHDKQMMQVSALQTRRTSLSRRRFRRRQLESHLQEP